MWTFLKHRKNHKHECIYIHTYIYTFMYPDSQSTTFPALHTSAADTLIPPKDMTSAFEDKNFSPLGGF